MAETSVPVNKVLVTGQRPRRSQTFNISNFRSQVDSLGGIAKTSLYRVEISMPKMPLNSKINTEKLTFLVASVSFPGVRLTTQPVQRYGQGPMEDMPTGFTFGTCEMNILGDAEGNVLKFFRDWTRGIVEYQSATGGTLQNRALPNMKPYHVNYKQNFETQISIVLYDTAGRQVYKVTLLRAFPFDLINMFLAWSNYDQVMYIPVRFQFFDVAFGESGDEVTSGFGASAQYQGLSLIETINSGGATFQTLSDAFRTPQNLGDVVNSINNTVLGIRQIGNIFGG